MQSAKPKHQGNPKKISKKSKKDEPDNEGLDPKTIEAIFWEFIDDDEDMELQLPPMSRESRKGMHEIAGILGLKSVSFGSGASRATTLSKIPKKMNQRRGNRAQVRELFERWAKTVVAGEEWVDSKTKGKKKKEAGGGARGTKGRKHKEGDIVGQHAAKIDEANVGYQLLQAMGWTEGARIGASGGLEAPLKAVFKSTRLGLGHF
ncbi:hypothetical protein FRB99_002090 [Tulasnella sp. 403]|nr:hypothetical protein FRB99_002090 [Tulasnella sp. 403]